MIKNRTRTKNKYNNCEFCGKEFIHYNWDDQRFCSVGCGSSYKKIETTCDMCGFVFCLSKSTFERTKKHFCCKKCYSNVEIIKRLKEIQLTLIICLIIVNVFLVAFLLNAY